MNRERQRVFVGKLYPGKMWKRKVARMTDAQVMAIFLRERPRLKPPEKKEKPDAPEF